ncbi:Casein kinase substrate phosphoprotein PP28 family protein [Babesia bovis T2Bo]|uniref:Platelet-derived growth factor-associated protein, putative n=1 Tax=Babesia bovis TaxID=5865 RepID=A7AS64_BABBO|nr:Casein kinase substrate phosphoprotein PP28 family protein [Babesia bovis T2Bo]EDO07383.1 Casein kinase substrate phosphoprotein PP28 family protein [Babesia bovis T2Bo]|eukprot:XP_001610951.1 platelet-derived growth factor-associated protein [Babesia bovis T2Bo]
MQRKRGSSKKYTAKGRSRYVATEDEIIARNAEMNSRDSNEESSDNDSDEPEQPERHTSTQKQMKTMPSSSSEDEEEDSSSSEFEICNPNRNPRPIEKTGVVELSRREREELQRQNFERQKMTLMAQGKLKSAQADLARLAEIRKQREAALARKMEQMSLKENQ